MCSLNYNNLSKWLENVGSSFFYISLSTTEWLINLKTSLNMLVKFPQSCVFNILKRESTIPPNEETIRHNICNVELQPTIADI